MSELGSGEPGSGELHTELLVVGGGPAGYTAAFRAADLGLDVTLVEREATLGGVCLNVGCIPSKALLHAAGLITAAQDAAGIGIAFGTPTVDLGRLREWNAAVIARLTGGLSAMARSRGVRVVHADAAFAGERRVLAGSGTIDFDHAILATGSRNLALPGVPYGDRRVMTSTEALALEDIPSRLLIVGGGIIGLELATVYDALGSRVMVVELAPQLMPEADADLVAPLAERAAARYEAIHLSTRLAGVEATDEGLTATFERVDSAGSAEGATPDPEPFDRALIAVGRTPNSDGIGLDDAGVELDAHGHVRVDARLQTSNPAIYAVGDLAGPPLLAHKATHEAKLAAEAVAGVDVQWDVRAVPSVAYTNPEIAWVGVTERQAEQAAIDHRCAVFPWAASGRAQTERAAGQTKLILDRTTGRVIGGGIVGAHAGELIAEIGVAIEMGADTQDLALIVHPHPTLSETVALAAEVARGTVTDLPPAAARASGRRA